MRYSENEKKISKKKYKKETQLQKKKGKCYNCGKERHFARKYRLSKTNHAKIDNPKKKRKRKI
jgi:hypothetical protein